MASSSRAILAVLVATAVGLALCIALIFGAPDRLSLRTAETNVDFQLSQLRDTIEANVGLFWPKRAILRKPGVAVVEFLPAIPAGLSNNAFMAELEARIEASSTALLAEAGFKG